MTLNESNVISNRLYFHGRTMGYSSSIEKLYPPTTYKPFFVSGDLNYALSYANDAAWKGSVDKAEVYLITLNPNARVFDPTNEKDMSMLENLNFWPDEIIDMMRQGTDILMVMAYASKHRITNILSGSGPKSYRDYLCKQLEKLGFDMFKTTEEVDGDFSDLVYGIFNLNGLGSIYPQKINPRILRRVGRKINAGIPTSEIIQFVVDHQN